MWSIISHFPKTDNLSSQLASFRLILYDISEDQSYLTYYFGLQSSFIIQQCSYTLCRSYVSQTKSVAIWYTRVGLITTELCSLNRHHDDVIWEVLLKFLYLFFIRLNYILWLQSTVLLYFIFKLGFLDKTVWSFTGWVWVRSLKGRWHHGKGGGGTSLTLCMKYTLLNCRRDPQASICSRNKINIPSLNLNYSVKLQFRLNMSINPDTNTWHKRQA